MSPGRSHSRCVSPRQWPSVANSTACGSTSTGGVRPAATRSTMWLRACTDRSSTSAARSAVGARRQEIAGVGFTQQRADHVAAPVQIGRGHDQLPEPGLPQALGQHLGVARAERVGVGVAGGAAPFSSCQSTRVSELVNRRGVDRRAQHAPPGRSRAGRAAARASAHARPPSAARRPRPRSRSRRAAARWPAPCPARRPAPARLIAADQRRAHARRQRCRARSRADRRRAPWRRRASSGSRSSAASSATSRPSVRTGGVHAVETGRGRSPATSRRPPTCAPGRRSRASAALAAPAPWPASRSTLTPASWSARRTPA